MEIATVLDKALLRLRVPRREAARELQASIKIGQAIRSQRIREMRDLDEARREKQEWLQRTLEMLERIVSTEAWAEQFNDYIATILPEYAEFDMFVDIFEEEMKHRLGRLNAMLKVLNDIPEPLPPRDPSTEQQRPHPEVPSDSRPQPQQQTRTQPYDSTFAEETMTQAVMTNPLAEPDPPRATPSSAVHGALILRTPDEPTRQSLTQFTQRMGITLHVIDRQNPGANSMLEALSSQRTMTFAIVLVDPANGTGSTPDDMFELGCCVGRLGANRVYALHRGGEAGLDRHGVAHVPVDGSEGWQLTLARLLKKAGVAVDLNKLV